MATKATTTMIRATSRVSVKVKDSFYTVEFCEERQVHDDTDVEEARKELWETVNGEVDNQVAELFEL